MTEKLYRICPACNGSGYVDDDPLWICPVCEAEGWIRGSGYVRAEDAERYARLGRAALATRELGGAQYYARKASQCERLAAAVGDIGAGPYLEDAAAYSELEAALRAIEEVEGEG